MRACFGLSIIICPIMILKKNPTIKEKKCLLIQTLSVKFNYYINRYFHFYLKYSTYKFKIQKRYAPTRPCPSARAQASEP